MSLTTAFTIIVTLVALLALTVFDIWTYLERGNQTTISYNILMDSKANPIIPAIVGLIIGVIFGHLFWPQVQ